MSVLSSELPWTSRIPERTQATPPMNSHMMLNICRQPHVFISIRCMLFQGSTILHTTFAAENTRIQPSNSASRYPAQNSIYHAPPDYPVYSMGYCLYRRVENPIQSCGITRTSGSPLSLALGSRAAEPHHDQHCWMHVVRRNFPAARVVRRADQSNTGRLVGACQTGRRHADCLAVNPTADAFVHDGKTPLISCPRTTRLGISGSNSTTISNDPDTCSYIHTASCYPHHIQIRMRKLVLRGPNLFSIDVFRVTRLLHRLPPSLPARNIALLHDFSYPPYSKPIFIVAAHMIKRPCRC
jgi:hypothetical protein